MVCASRITRRISGFLKRTKKDSIDQCHYPRDGGLWVNRGGGVGARGGEITIFCRNYFVMRAYRRMNSFSLLILFRRGYAMVRTHLLALLLLLSISLVPQKGVAAGGSA